MITPWTVLATVSLALGLIWLIDRTLSRRRRRRLGSLAASHHWRFNADDRFNLACRVAPRLPIIGAADVRVRDLMYRVDGDAYRYAFTAECTSGTVTGPDRTRLILLATDAPGGELQVLRIADAHCEMIEQYRALIEPNAVQ